MEQEDTPRSEVPDNIEPSWTPDGTRIVFARQVNGGAYDIWTVNADGSGGLTDLTQTSRVNELTPEWSPDGSTIADWRDGNQIWRMSASGTQQSPLSVASNTADPTGISWAPDGSKLAYVVTLGGSNTDIWTVNRDGGGDTQLTHCGGRPCFSGNGLEVHWPSWSPDGTKLVVEGGLGADFSPVDLYQVNASTGAETKIRHTSDSAQPWWGATPPPLPGRSVDVAPVSGIVRVKRPGDTGFIRLHAGERVPVGSTVNATRGVVSLVAASDRYGHTATGQAHGGVFRLTQREKGAIELTVLVLAGAKPTGCSTRGARAARRHSRHRPLVVRDPGYFVTVGIYASAKDRATTQTKWWTEDTCDGTRITAVQGAVLVHDFPHHRTFLLRAGDHFLAHPGKGG